MNSLILPNEINEITNYNNISEFIDKPFFDFEVLMITLDLLVFSVGALSFFLDFLDLDESRALEVWTLAVQHDVKDSFKIFDEFRFTEPELKFIFNNMEWTNCSYHYLLNEQIEESIYKLWNQPNITLKQKSSIGRLSCLVEDIFRKYKDIMPKFILAKR